METEHIVEIIKHIREKANCQVDVQDNKEEITVKLKLKGLPSNSDYLLSFFEADGSGTLGIKIRWTLGKVANFSEVWKCLVLNEKKFLDQGPLFTAIIPSGDDGLFSFVGQMIFPPGTSSEEIATLWFNQAFLNYAMFEISVPGVVMF